MPQGFQYFPDFITIEEEEDLISLISATGLHSFQFQGYEAKRKVASFGYDWNFNSRTLLKGKDIPQSLTPFIEKVSHHLQLPEEEFAEVLFTEYPAGSLINWHRDAPPFNLIAGLSLFSDCVFRLRPFEKPLRGRRSVLSLPVKRRSLYVLEGISRNDWEHSIAALPKMRYSVTLRTLRTGVNGQHKNC